jgi:hypothetical protein
VTVIWPGLLVFVPYLEMLMSRAGEFDPYLRPPPLLVSGSPCMRAKNASTIALSNGAPESTERSKTGLCDLLAEGPLPELRFLIGVNGSSGAGRSTAQGHSESARDEQPSWRPSIYQPRWTRQ